MPEIKEFGVFPRERFMYEDMLASLEKIWFEKTREEIQFCPRGIKFVTDPYEILVIDNLKAAKYEMVDRKVGTSLEETKLLLSKLAKYHALSALRYQKEGIIKNYFDRKQKSFVMDFDSPLIIGILRILNQAIKALRRYGDCDIYADKMEKFDKEKMLKCFIIDDDPLRCGFKVLNHGDLFINNIMFKFDEKREPIDVILFDFQASFWGSPLIDVLTYLIISVSDDAKIDYFDDFIEFYHAELSDALKKIGYEKRIPNLAEIQIDVMEKGHLAAARIPFLFFTKLSSTEDFSFEKIMKETDEKALDDMFERIYNNEGLKKAIKLWLPFLNERGFIDSLLMSNDL